MAQAHADHPDPLEADDVLAADADADADADAAADADVAADADGNLDVEGAVYRLLVRELGEKMGEAFIRARAVQERWARQRRPQEGLRERKKRLTRQQISDVATTLFVVRGFDHVTVSEIAEIVGVSEKTVYNYFPTKESLVFDRVDEGISRLVAALRERETGESPTRAMLRAIREDTHELEEQPEEIQMFLPVFSEMIASTPSLHAAWLELQERIVKVANEELAARAEIDPREPEPMIAARAIVGLQELAFTSRIRHIEAGLRGGELREAVLADLERAARLLDTGLWSFSLLTHGKRTRQQLRDAAAAAEDARGQVIDTLRQARAAWREIRRHEHQEVKRALKESLRDVQASAERAAYEAFQQALSDRRAALRERRQAAKRPGGEI
jgi:AcrR family transcriptional regulator